MDTCLPLSPLQVTTQHYALTLINGRRIFPSRSVTGETDMAWYAYCITEQQAFQGTTRARRPFPIESLHGVNGTQVFGYPSGDFAVIVSEYVSNGQLKQQAVVEHARVVSYCFER